jgi:hypothetical protein
MVFTILNHPSGAEAQDFDSRSCGTAEAVPFQNNPSMDFYVHAIALLFTDHCSLFLEIMGRLG